MFCNNWRIASSLAGLATGFLDSYRIPPPSAPQYIPYSQQVDVGEGATFEHGYRNVQLVWGNLTRPQLNALQRLIDSAGVGRLYMTIDKFHGDNPSDEWVDISGYPRKSSPSPSNSVDRSTSPAFGSFTLILNNVNVINDPANF